MQKVLLFCGIGLFLCCGGCARTFAALATPTQWEIKVPAEYKLADNKPQKMLVLVEQPAWTAGGANIRVYLTKAIESQLEGKVGIKAAAFVPYQKLADMRNNSPDFSMLSPPQVAKALGANMVLYIVIDNFGLYGMSDVGYYKGQLDTRSGLYDAASGQMLWPESGELKSSSVGFEVQKGEDEAARRLATSTARCIVRYLYDCSKKEFKVGDESGREDMKVW
jgi:hypothetical protein